MEASPISVLSNDSGYSSNSCSSKDLPSSSYDGSHLHWKSFRQHVLEPHRIQVLDSAPKECIPDTFLALIEVGLEDTCRFDSQKAAFRAQVAAGRGFGPSPLFPPNLLPPFNNDQGLAQCMLPAFSREALPPRLSSHKGPLYELSVPRSNLGCGFSASALTADELQCLPSFMVPTGTAINYETGYISPGSAIYSPFLTFERAQGVKEHRLEAANNQCALGGAWSVRAMRLLQLQAFSSDAVRQMPIAFSCAIDNTFAIINVHWTDPKQTYYMSPLCKFDLNNDDHFTKFLIWVEAIGSWAVQHVLPSIKQALQKILVKGQTPPSTPEEQETIILTLDTIRPPAEQLMRSLKTTFDDVPWRFDSQDCTPVSSSTASWGSPMTTDIQFTFPPRPDGEDFRTESATSSHTSGTKTLIVPRSPTDQVHLAAPSDLILAKRLSHALDEIRDLYQQIHILKINFHNATNTTQSELGVVKVTLASILRKETLISRNRSLSVGHGAGLGLNLAGSTEVWYGGQAHILPSSQRLISSHEHHSPTPAMSPSSGLGITRAEALATRPQLSPRPSPLTLSRSNTSPPIYTPPNAPTLPSLPSPEPSPLPTSRTIIPPTPYTPYTIIPPPPPEFASNSLIKWSAITFSAHMAASFIPIMSLRIVALGMITEAALLGFSSPHYGVSWEWMMRLVQQ